MILILVSQFNAIITEQLEKSAVQFLEKKKIKYEVVHVPGSLELPIAAQHFIRTKKPKAVLALGCVIKGETDHYELVIQNCSEGLMRIALDESVPIIQGIIPSRTFEYAWERRLKGEEYAQTALKMVEILDIK